jgi:hypothetical protein
MERERRRGNAAIRASRHDLPTSGPLRPDRKIGELHVDCHEMSRTCYRLAISSPELHHIRDMDALARCALAQLHRLHLAPAVGPRRNHLKRSIDRGVVIQRAELHSLGRRRSLNGREGVSTGTDLPPYRMPHVAISRHRMSRSSRQQKSRPHPASRHLASDVWLAHYIATVDGDRLAGDIAGRGAT